MSVRATASPSPLRPQASATFVRGPTIATGAREASDVVALPDGRLLVVSDVDDFATLVGPGSKRARLPLPELRGKESQLEAVTYDPKKQRLFVIREERAELLRYDWPLRGEPTLDKTFDLGRPDAKNKGFEGLAYLPAEHTPDGEPRLLLAHEGKPRRLFWLDDSGKGALRELALEGAAKELLRDFSALAVEPTTGHLFVASDESGAVAELALRFDGDEVQARLVQAFPVGRAQRIEGLTFDAQGTLYVLTENDGKLHTFRRR